MWKPQSWEEAYRKCSNFLQCCNNSTSLNARYKGILKIYKVPASMYCRCWKFILFHMVCSFPFFFCCKIFCIPYEAWVHNFLNVGIVSASSLLASAWKRKLYFKLYSILWCRALYISDIQLQKNKKLVWFVCVEIIVFFLVLLFTTILSSALFPCGFSKREVVRSCESHFWMIFRAKDLPRWRKNVENNRVYFSAWNFHRIYQKLLGSKYV